MSDQYSCFLHGDHVGPDCPKCLRTSKTNLKAQLVKYLPLAKSHLLMIAHREDLSISVDAKARLAELEVLEMELRQPDETSRDDAAFEAGWRAAAEWAKRDDLVHDINSPAYRIDRFNRLKRLAKETAPGSPEEPIVEPPGQRPGETPADLGRNGPPEKASEHRHTADPLNLSRCKCGAAMPPENGNG